MHTTLMTELERQKARFQTLLRYLLELRAPEGHLLISAELFLGQIMEDCEDRYGWSGKVYSTPEIIDFAYGKGTLNFGSGDMSVVYGKMEWHYRHLVCGIGKPDWLCGCSGPQLLHPDYPVYVADHDTRKEYVFAIKPMADVPQYDPKSKPRK